MGSGNSHLKNFKIYENNNISIDLDKQIYFLTEPITGKLHFKLVQSCQIQAINISLIQSQFWTYSDTDYKYDEKEKKSKSYETLNSENLEKVLSTENIIKPGTFFNSGLNTIDFKLLDVFNLNIYQSRSFEYIVDSKSYAFNRYKLKVNIILNNNQTINDNNFLTETIFFLKNIPDIKLNSPTNSMSQVNLYKYLFFNNGKCTMFGEIKKNYFSIEDYIPIKIKVDNSRSKIRFVYFYVNLYCRTIFKPYSSNFTKKFENKILSEKNDFIVEPGEIKETEYLFNLQSLKSSNKYLYDIKGMEKSINKDLFYCTVNDNLFSNEYYISIVGYFYNTVPFKPKIIFDINLGHYNESKTNKENTIEIENNSQNNYPNVNVINQNNNSQNNYPNLNEINQINNLENNYPNLNEINQNNNLENNYPDIQEFHNVYEKNSNNNENNNYDAPAPLPGYENETKK